MKTIIFETLQVSPINRTDLLMVAAIMILFVSLVVRATRKATDKGRFI